MLADYCDFSPDVRQALDTNSPVLALESTIISHGMPYPQNFEFARQAETLTRNSGATPATIAIISGRIKIGVNEEELRHLANNKAVEKTATRDLAATVTAGADGATTVSATMHLAHLAGIKVFATGGIGGVHRGAHRTFDISQDLIELSRTPMVVVSAGAKAILDLPLTLEYLETQAVPVLGYRTGWFPAFYSSASATPVPRRVETTAEIAAIYLRSRELQTASGLLIANPVPQEKEIHYPEIAEIINSAIDECDQLEITGPAVTPYLLAKISELTGGRSLETNRALAFNNIRLAAEIAIMISKG